jgi:hypothetical protein
MKSARLGRLFGGIATWLAPAALVPALAAAGSISGTVTAEGGGPLQGVEVCPTPQPYTFETTCVETGPAGTYKLDGLPGGSYLVHFSTQQNNLRYVSEFYDNERYNWEADLFPLGASENATLDVALAEGGSIGGTVTDEETEGPIAGIWTCAIDSQGIPVRCDLSDANGDYLLNGLPTGAYSVEYEGGNNVNYLREFYEDAATWAAATDVNVTAPATTSGIDAKLARGAEILGRVTHINTGAPLEGVMVCASQPEPAEYEACDWTTAAGNYALRSLPAGTYLVEFGIEFLPSGRTAGQWWNGASSAAEADPIVIAPPETRSGIDGQLDLFIPPPPPLPPDNPVVEDKVPPDTRITKGPARATFNRQAKFRFASTESGSAFQCKLDKGRWRACTSPFKRRVNAGRKHVFKVRAIDRSGNVDPTPARYAWQVKEPAAKR